MHLKVLHLFCIISGITNVITSEENYTSPVNFLLADAVKTDVKYRLFTKLSDEGQAVNENTVKLSNINKTGTTIFLIHGFTTDYNSPWYAPLRTAYFEKGPHNVVYVDWSLAGNKTYSVSSANAKPVGSYIADFILSSNVSLNNIHIIGHSLGSHVAGFVGKSVRFKINKNIGRITATDPAGPKFKNTNKDSRLSDEDADFVDVVHTDDGHYGYTAPIGHVDFYPNGGTPLQPGCPSLEDEVNCSHARANWIFIESINSNNFKSKQCKNWKAYKNGECDSNKNTVFGENVPNDVRGCYFFATNTHFPYAKI